MPCAGNYDKLSDNGTGTDAEAAGRGGIVIACGMARYEDDNCVAAVFERADHEMYENKSLLKSAAGG